MRRAGARAGRHHLHVRLAEDRARATRRSRTRRCVVAPGEFVSVVGPTGCGKSTLLNVAAGLLQPSAGRVTRVRRAARRPQPQGGYMFQTEALMPWRTALDNVTAGLEFRGVPRARGGGAGRGLAARVGLGGFGDRYPHQLSGGMRKRVALAQTLILDPEIMLMDEPFSALDIQTRQLMENELLELWSANRKSVIFITHDLEEAISLSDRVVVLSAGPEIAPDRRVRDRPAAPARRGRDPPDAALHRAARRDLARDEGRGAEGLCPAATARLRSAALAPGASCALGPGAAARVRVWHVLDQPDAAAADLLRRSAQGGVLLRRAAEGARADLGLVLLGRRSTRTCG